MMEHLFKEGQKIKALWWSDESCQSIYDDNVDEITVVMEYGQMAAVPWFAVWKDGKITAKHNGALVETVELLNEG